MSMPHFFSVELMGSSQALERRVPQPVAEMSCWMVSCIPPYSPSQSLAARQDFGPEANGEACSKSQGQLKPCRAARVAAAAACSKGQGGRRKAPARLLGLQSYAGVASLGYAVLNAGEFRRQDATPFFASFVLPPSKNSITSSRC